MRAKRNAGFSVLTILAVLFLMILAWAVIWIGVISAAICGNQWFTDDGVLKKIQLNHPKATQVVDTERNVFRESIISIQEEGQRIRYCLDSDILFNYNVKRCP